MDEAFSIGDRVQWLDEDLEGWICGLDADSCRIRTTEGIELEVSPKELVRIPGDAASSLGSAPLPEQPEPAEKQTGRPVRNSRKKGGSPPLEVDLHAEKLFPNLRGLAPMEILDRQMETARSQLEFALRKRIQRIVFIHGVGEGVLKAELRTLFRRYDGLRYGDADFRKYGLGATEVYIPQASFL